MKGLLIKDFYCLKKQLTTYCFIIAGVIVLSILFVLSCKFGNIRAGFDGMVASGECSQADVAQLASMALTLFMLLPIACTGDIFSLFQDDETASFYKLAAALPISIPQRILSRFIVGLLFIFVGVGVDFLMTIVLSNLTDIVSFGEFMGMILSFASVMIMYMSLLILFMHLLGRGKGTYANVLPLLIGIGTVVALGFDKLKKIIVESDDAALQALCQDVKMLITQKAYLLVMIAVIILVCSYGFSVILEKRKRGVA